jgi:hypothetical protein
LTRIQTDRPAAPAGSKRFPMIVDEVGKLHSPASCWVVTVTTDEEKELRGFYDYIRPYEPVGWDEVFDELESYLDWDLGARRTSPAVAAVKRMIRDWRVA